MSRFDELPPDQRAALSLLLRQHKSYAELAEMLGISERAVHDRAHAALAVLAPRQARDVAAERREEIGDYLLGQQRGVAERLATRTLLGSSAAAQAWAAELAGELPPLEGEALADIPAGATSGEPAADGSAYQATGPQASAARSGRAAPSIPSSRVAGALLLGAIVAGIVVAVILLSGGGGSHAKSAVASSTSATSSSSKAQASGSGPKVDQRLTLKSPDSASHAVAAVEILSEGGKRAFYIAAEHLAPSKGFYYAIWLYNSPSSSEPLTKSPTVGSDGKVAGGALLPSNAGNYHEMLVTRETSSRPTRPGTVVLQGPFSLGG
jgi:hypothetical protein